MAIIIGAQTTISFDFGDCATQISWGANSNVQRLYCIGQTSVYATIAKPTDTANITVYAGDSGTYDTIPSTSCADQADLVGLTIAATGCGGSANSPSTTQWYVNNYSYSKGDALTPATVSWGLIKHTSPNSEPLPDYVLKGVSEGTAVGIPSVVGLDFGSNTTYDSYQGSVSAGQTGRSDTQTTGQVDAVGGGSFNIGEIANGSASIQLQPLWL